MLFGRGFYFARRGRKIPIRHRGGSEKCQINLNRARSVEKQSS